MIILNPIISDSLEVFLVDPDGVLIPLRAHWNIDGTCDARYTAARGGIHKIIVKHHGGIHLSIVSSSLSPEIFLFDFRFSDTSETLNTLDVPILEADVAKEVEVEIMCLGEGLVAGVVDKKAHFDINFIGSDGSVVEKSRVRMEVFDPNGMAVNVEVCEEECGISFEMKGKRIS